MTLVLVNYSRDISLQTTDTSEYATTLFRITAYSAVRYETEIYSKYM